MPEKFQSFNLDPNLPVTYEVSSGESLHPDPEIASRMMEVTLGNCGYGCEIYADPYSNVRVLAHHRVYGCPK